MEKKTFYLFCLQPELAFSKSDYSRTSPTSPIPRTMGINAYFNCGIRGSIEQRLTKKIFLDGGVGYIARRLKTRVFFNQNVIPPPRQSPTQELNTAKFVNYRIIEFPLYCSYRFKINDTVYLSVVTGLIGNYLLNAKYGVQKKYGGQYKKDHFLGYSWNLGVGMESGRPRNIKIFARAVYSIVNKVKKDPYLFSQTEYQVAVTHHYLDLTMGIKLKVGTIKGN